MAIRGIMNKMAKSDEYIQTNHWSARQNFGSLRDIAHKNRNRQRICLSSRVHGASIMTDML